MKTKIKMAFVAFVLTMSTLLAMPALAGDIASPAVSAGSGTFSVEYMLDNNNLDPIEKGVFVQLFGGQFVDEEGSTALSKGIGYMNLIAMFLGVVVLSYVIFAGALNTAASGQVLGKSWSSVWLPLRITTGFGMIMPSAIGDFSTIQVLMSKLLMASSIFATVLWNHTADEVISFNTSFSAGVPLPPTSQALDLVGSSFCAINDFYRRNGDSREDPFPLYTIVVGDDSGKSITNTVVGGPGGSPYSMANGTYIKSIRFGSTGDCGTIEVFEGDITKAQPGTTAAVKAASKVVIDTLNNAHQLENEARQRKINSRNIELYLSSSANSSGEDAAQFQKETAIVASAGAEIIANYPRAMYQAIIGGFKSGTDLEEAKSKLITQKSWIFAPANYMRLAQHSTAPNTVVQKLGEGVNNTSWRMCKPGANDCPTRSPDKTVRSISTDYTHVSTMLLIGEIERSVNSLNTSPSVQGASSSSSSTGDGASGCTGSDCKQNKFVVDYTSQAETIIFGADFLNKSGQFLSDSDQYKQEGIGQISLGNIFGGNNPYSVLSGIGHALNGLLVATWGVGLGAAALAHGIGGSALGLAGGASASGAFDYVVKTMWPLFLGMYMAGAVLAYLIPFLPILRWTWAVLNWMLLLVEAMTAAPLAVIMMITPEGEGIAGAKTEKALMLVYQVVLWPSILVISFLAMISISIAGFSFTNMMLFSDVTQYNDSGFFDFVARAVFWVVVMTSLCHACAGIMDTFPRVMFEWIGGGMSRSMNNNPEQNAEQSVKNLDNKITQGLAAASSGIKTRPRE
jgi:conjugal transfer/type IV secretion protein DotA/TraY